MTALLGSSFRQQQDPWSPTEFLYQHRAHLSNDLRTVFVTYAPSYGAPRRHLVDVLIARLNELLRLRPGWDGEKAPAISETAVIAAIEWFERLVDDESIAPQVFPLPDGGVQLEWLASGDGLEVEVSPFGEVGVLGVDSAGNVIVEGDYPHPDGTTFVRLTRKHLAAISMAAASGPSFSA